MNLEEEAVVDLDLGEKVYSKCQLFLRRIGSNFGDEPDVSSDTNLTDKESSGEIPLKQSSNLTNSNSTRESQIVITTPEKNNKDIQVNIKEDNDDILDVEDSDDSEVVGLGCYFS